MTNNTERECDVLVIGSGAAGLTLALKLADENPNINLIVLSKGPIEEGSTSKAQGGIAAVCNVYADNDSLESLIMTVWNPMLQIHWLQEPGYAKRTL